MISQSHGFVRLSKRALSQIFHVAYKLWYVYVHELNTVGLKQLCFVGIMYICSSPPSSLLTCMRTSYESTLFIHYIFQLRNKTLFYGFIYFVWEIILGFISSWNKIWFPGQPKKSQLWRIHMYTSTVVIQYYVFILIFELWSFQFCSFRVLPRLQTGSLLIKFAVSDWTIMSIMLFVSVNFKLLDKYLPLGGNTSVQLSFWDIYIIHTCTGIPRKEEILLVTWIGVTIFF